MICSYRRCELRFDLRHDLQDALLFFENIVGELFGREMFEIA